MKIHILLIMGVVTLGLVPVAYAQNGDSYDNSADVSTRDEIVKPHVSFKLETTRDPMLSSDDLLLIRHREQQRLAAEAAERKRRAEEERRRLAEEEKRRRWELALIKDPTLLVRDKIRISGLIDKEVLINGKLYTVGHTYQGAKIVAVGADSVTFSYKGHKFVKKVSI